MKEIEQVAQFVESLTYRKRWAKAAVNGRAKEVPPCEIAAAIRKFAVNSGAPPHVGWWLCDSDWWRWWDGSAWSHGVRAGAKPSTVRRAAAKPIPARNHDAISWSDYWPPGARVPRIKP